MTGGCAGSWTRITSTKPAKLDARVLQAYRRLPNSRQCPYRVQQAIAEHNAVHASNVTGNRTIYKPVQPAPKAKPAGVPAT